MIQVLVFSSNQGDRNRWIEVDGNSRLHSRGSDFDIFLDKVGQATSASAGDGLTAGGELGQWNALDTAAHGSGAGLREEGSRCHRRDDIRRVAGQEVEETTVRIAKVLFVGSAGLHRTLFFKINAYIYTYIYKYVYIWARIEGSWRVAHNADDLPVSGDAGQRRTCGIVRGSSSRGRGGTAGTRTERRPTPRSTPGKPASISSAINNQSEESNGERRYANEFLPCRAADTEYDWAQQISYLYGAKGSHFLGIWKQ